MSLLDIIKQRKQARPAATAAGDVAALQQTAATGKAAAPTTGPAVSGVQSQLAAQAGAAQQQQIGLAGMVADQQLGAAERLQQQQIEQQQRQQRQRHAQQLKAISAETQITDARRQAEDQMARERLKATEQANTTQLNNSYAEALKELATNRQIVEQDIFSQAKQERQQLTVDKYEAHLEQIAHITALSDRKYIDEITRIGRLRNLQDDIEFRREAIELAFGNDLEILNQQFDMQRLMNVEEREFKNAMADIDINTAVELAKIAAKEQAYANIIQGTTTAAAAAFTYSMNPAKPTTTTTPTTVDASSPTASPSTVETSAAAGHGRP